MKLTIPIIIALLLTVVFVQGAGSGGGGDSGSSYSGGGSSKIIDIASATKEIEVTMQKGEFYTLRLDDSYSLFIRNFNEAEATLVLATKPSQVFNVKLGETHEIDVNNNGTADISFTPDYIISDKSIKTTFSPKTTQLESKKQLEEKTEQGLLCGDKPTRKERVECRLSLSEDELKYEYELRFLPEECIPLEGEQKASCIKIYKSVQSCWQFRNDQARVSCVKNQLNFKGVSEEIKACTSLKAEEKSNCIEAVKNNVFTITKFKMYNLEEKAEELMEEGKISSNEGISFISEVEGKKIEFNNATTIAEKRQIIADVNKLWNEFLKKITT